MSTKASVQLKAIGSPDPGGSDDREKVAWEISDNLIVCDLNEIPFLKNSTARQDSAEFVFVGNLSLSN